MCGDWARTRACGTLWRGTTRDCLPCLCSGYLARRRMATCSAVDETARLNKCAFAHTHTHTHTDCRLTPSPVPYTHAHTQPSVSLSVCACASTWGPGNKATREATTHLHICRYAPTPDIPHLHQWPRLAAQKSRAYGSLPLQGTPLLTVVPWPLLQGASPLVVMAATLCSCGLSIHGSNPYLHTYYLHTTYM